MRISSGRPGYILQGVDIKTRAQQIQQVLVHRKTPSFTITQEWTLALVKLLGCHISSRISKCVDIPYTHISHKGKPGFHTDNLPGRKPLNTPYIIHHLRHKWPTSRASYKECRGQDGTLNKFNVQFYEKYAASDLYTVMKWMEHLSLQSVVKCFMCS